MNYKQEFKEENIKTQVILDYSGTKTSGSTPSNVLKSQFSLNKVGENYNLKLTGKYNFSGTEIDDLSINGNITLKHNYTFSDELSSALTLLYTDKNPENQEADREFKPKWNLKYKGNGYTLDIIAEKRFDLDGDTFTGDNVSKGIDHLPEFIFKKASAKIGETKVIYTIEGSVGHFYETSTEEDNVRGEMIFNFKRPFDFGDYISITPTGIFQQDVYLTGKLVIFWAGKLM